MAMFGMNCASSVRGFGWSVPKEINPPVQEALLFLLNRGAILMNPLIGVSGFDGHAGAIHKQRFNAAEIIIHHIPTFFYKQIMPLA